MPSLWERIHSDLKSAMLEKNAGLVSALRMLKSAVKNFEISKKSTVSDQEVMDIIRKQVKQRLDSIEAYQKAKRSDLIETEQAEILVLQRYLPQEIADSELEPLLRKLLKDHQLSSKKDFGKAMKLAQDAVKGKASNQRLSTLLQKLLS